MQQSAPLSIELIEAVKTKHIEIKEEKNTSSITKSSPSIEKKTQNTPLKLKIASNGFQKKKN